jgi:hypothetical protein
MHILGLNGMPRRVYTYLEPMGWGRLNLIATVGAMTIAASVLVFVINAMRSWRSGLLAGDNPWRSSGLEWATTSPPPPYNFLHTPVVHSLHPLWETSIELEVATGLRSDRREFLMTTSFDAQPDSIHVGPAPSIWPFYVALCMALLFIGSIFSPYMVLVGIGASVLGLAGWAWQSVGDIETERIALPDGVIVDRA